jgi:FolB domain-containing protein
MLQGTLKLLDLTLKVHLGCSEEEQAHPQEIRISLEIGPEPLPQACFSDRLEDTRCYGALADRLRMFCFTTRFRTVEKLAMSCFEVVKSGFPESTQLKLKLHKIRPPVDSLQGGVVFEIHS